MDDNTVNLELITRGSVNREGNFVIEGIPRRVMTSFRKRAKEIMPEKGEKAWSALLCEVISAHLETSEQTTYIMTEIPLSHIRAMEDVANQVNLTVDNIMAGLIRAAGNNSLHLLNLHFPPEMEHTGWRSMLIMGISNEAWASWADYAEKMGTTPEELYGHILEAAYLGKLETTPTNTDIDTSERIKKMSEMSEDEIKDMVDTVQAEVDKAKRRVDLSDWDVSNYE